MNCMFKHVHILGKATEKSLGVKLVIEYLPNRYFIATLYNSSRMCRGYQKSPDKFYKAVLEPRHRSLANLEAKQVSIYQTNLNGPHVPLAVRGRVQRIDLDKNVDLRFLLYKAEAEQLASIILIRTQ